jgi:hypothetical protein
MVVKRLVWASPTVALVERMGSEIDHLREQLDKEREANRENRRLLAAALERIPAIEAGDERESPVTAMEDTSRGGGSPGAAGARRAPLVVASVLRR